MKGSPPPAPDYVGAAQAQGAANIETARTQAQLNNPNVVSPYGTQTVSYGQVDQNAFNQAMEDYNFRLRRGDQNITMPTQEQFRVNTDIPTVTQTFSPEQQALYDQQTRTQGQLGALGEQGANSLFGVVGQQLNLSGLPQAPGSATDTRNQVIDAMMSRVNEDTGRQKDQLNSDLIAAGIRPGSKAYDDQMNLVNRGYNDARNQAYVSAGQEAQRDFGMDTQRRQQALSETLAQRQTPLNEITALLSGSQVSNPFAMPGYAQNTQIQPSPLFAATNAAGNYATDVYNAQQAQQGNLMNGLFGLGSSAITRFSDRRLKSNIVRIGTHPLGIGWYRYQIAGRQEEGVMADEVMMVKPSAIRQHASGYLTVDYGGL